MTSPASVSAEVAIAFLGGRPSSIALKREVAKRSLANHQCGSVWQVFAPVIFHHIAHFFSPVPAYQNRLRSFFRRLVCEPSLPRTRLSSISETTYFWDMVGVAEYGVSRIIDLKFIVCIHAPLHYTASFNTGNGGQKGVESDSWKMEPWLSDTSDRPFMFPCHILLSI